MLAADLRLLVVLSLSCISAVGPLLTGCGAQTTESPPAKQLLRPLDTPDPTEAVEGPSRSLTVPHGTTGPFLSGGNGEGLLVWTTNHHDSAAFWTQLVATDGTIQGQKLRVSDSPAEVQLIHVAPAVKGMTWVAFSTSSEQPQIWLLGLGTAGELVTEPKQLTEAPNEILWLDTVPLADGTLVFWAERGRGTATLYAMLVGNDGAPRTPVTRIVGAATAWQVRRHERGALLAAIDETAQVRLVVVGDDAQVVSDATLTGSEGAQRDIDLALTPHGWVLAFSQRRPLQSHLVTALLDPRLKPARPVDFAVAPTGDQELLQLVGSSAAKTPTYLVWRDGNSTSNEIRVAPLNRLGLVADEPLVIRVDGDQAAEFAATDGEFQALVWACPFKARCQSPTVPTLLQFNSQLEPSGISAWAAGDTPPNLAWGLSCGKSECLSLAATFDKPPMVHTMSTQDQGSWATPAFKQESRWPDAQIHQAVLGTDRLADFDVLRSDGGTLVATLSDFDPTVPYKKPATPAPDGRLAPVRALLRTASLPTKPNRGLAQTTEVSEVISYRARSIAGVSLSARKEQVLLAWTALIRNESQVFTTLLDARGAKKKQAMFTRKRGEVYHLQSAPMTDGFLLGWIDERRGRKDAYVAKLGPNLRRLSNDTRMSTQAPATGIDVQSSGREIWIALTVADGSVRLKRLRSDTLTLRGEELIVAQTEGAREPQLVINADYLIVSWLADGSAPGMLSVKIPRSDLKSPKPTISHRGGAMEHISLACPNAQCTAIASDGSQLLQGELKGRAALKRLLRTSSTLPPRTVDNEVWYYEPIESGPALHRAVLMEPPLADAAQ